MAKSLSALPIAAVGLLLVLSGPSLAQTPSSAEVAARAALIFASVDSDRDGFLTANELDASGITVALGPATAPAADRGAPSRSELAALSTVNRFLRLFDSNRDGRVSRDEFQRAVASSASR